MNNEKKATLSFDKNTPFNPELKSVLNALPYYVLLVDENHNILFANNAVTNQFGLSPESVIGGYCPKVIHGQDKEIPECPLEESCISGCPVEREIFDEKNNLWISSAIYPTDMISDRGTKIFYHTVHNITKRKTAENDLKNSLIKLQKITEDSIHAITLIVEKRDPFTAGHQTKVGDIAYAIAGEMGYTERFSYGLRITGLLHDVGKIAVPADILSKPGKISENEFQIIQTHSAAGFDILKEIDFEWPIAKAVLQHHERLNGSGYPSGLKGDEISQEARIIAVADVLNAMTSHRPYRPALSVEAAINELTDNRNILYDSDVVDACLRLYEESRLIL